MSSFFDEFVDNQAVPTGQMDDDGPILGVEVGNTYTRAMLLEAIEGMYRFVSFGEAPTTNRIPWDNLLAGMANALRPIEQAATRSLLDPGNQLIIPRREAYVGVEDFFVTMSGGKPIKAAVVGLMPSVSIDSLKRALANIYVDVVDTYSLVDPRPPEAFLNLLLDSPPDAIVITGGTNGGTVKALQKRVDIVAMACASMPRDSRPVVIYAGNVDLHEEVQAVFDEINVGVLLMDNPRPSLDHNALDKLTDELTTVFQQYHLRETPHFRTLDRWSMESVYPAAQGFMQLIKVMGHINAESYLGIDIGSSSTVIAAYVDGAVYSRVFNDMGVGLSAHTALNKVGIASVARWAPEAEAVDIQRMLLNRSLYPHTVPHTLMERSIEYALVREIIRKALLELTDDLPSAYLPNINTILLSGAVLTRAPAAGLSVMNLLDVLEPNGYTRILGDPYGIAAMLGRLAMLNPRAFVQVVDSGVFIDMANVFSSSGRSRQGKTVVEGQITGDHGLSVPVQAEGDSLTTIPFAGGLEGTFTFETSGVNFDIPKESGTYQQPITGSEAGVIIDTRTYPITLPRNNENRLEQLQAWRDAVSRMPEQST